MSAPTQELVDDVFRRRVLQARRTPPEQRMLDCIDLFEKACLQIRDGIRAQFPDADVEEVQQILCQRIERLRSVEEYGIYHPLPHEAAT